MRIFLSYASQDREIAKAIELGLREQGHDVFFDRDDLPPGEEFHTRIRRAIARSHLVVFLVSPDAVDAGSYTLTELEIAERTWTRASGKLLPVLLRPTPMDAIPPFVSSVTFLETTGSVPAAVAAAVERLGVAHRRRVLGRLGGAAALVLLLAFVAYRYWPRAAAPAEIARGQVEQRGDTVRGDSTRADTLREKVARKDEAPETLVPAGTFTMGDDEESPRREVYVDSFYIDQFEVTVARYARFLAATGSARAPEGWDTLNVAAIGRLPVVNVDWHDAAAYCAWAGARLPTEAEWEKAARGTDGRTFPWGNAPPAYDLARYENMSPSAYNGGLAPVGTHRPGASPYGAQDMAGNALEWVADWHAESFRRGDTRNPKGPDSGTGRVLRGGGRFDPGYRITATKRWFADPTTRNEEMGFRCARDVR